ncbi:MAG: undecaprenyl-diphosphate phosphatase [Candidatus Chisholmbacteria bacterium]|nr:undecaprenyl-diphosphate phosphatase [Candidatus Chisholmbacteria bacterium]
MTLIQAFILGLIQGLTEFLPISSSGHLVIAQHLFGMTEPPVLFDVVVHFGTLAAVIFFFAQDIIHLNISLIKKLVAATIPTGIIGLLLNPYTETLFQSLPITMVGFVLTSILLLYLRNQKASPKKNALSLSTALIIGTTQGIAIMPGLSRSGSTIAVALLRGLKPETAFSFSFLLSVPAITAATLLKFSEISTPPDLSSLGVGFITAAITGFLTLKLLRNILLHHHFYRFGIYTALLTLVLLFGLLL